MGTLNGLAIPDLDAGLQSSIGWNSGAPAPSRIDVCLHHRLQHHAALCFEQPVDPAWGASIASSLRNAFSTCFMSCWDSQNGAVVGARCDARGGDHSQNRSALPKSHGCVRCDGKELVDSVRLITVALSGSAASE